MKLPAGILASVLLLGAACGEGSGTSPARPPNVVVVVLDTTRADRCSAYGYARPTTPVLDSVAAEGALFLNALTPSSWTGPAHASLFTGLRPEHHGFLSGRLREYLREMPTLARWFREAGYRTACFSNSPYVSREFGLDQGFELETREFEAADGGYPTAPATHRRALKWVRERLRQDERFLLFVNDMEPHAPYTPPFEFERTFVPPSVPSELREWGRQAPWYTSAQHMLGVERLAPERIQVLSDLYDAEVACVDQALGILVEGLKRLDTYDDTIFVAAGDHGESFGEHDCLEHMSCMYRPVLHVPLAIRYPARFAAGTRIEPVVRLEDVAPTLLKLSGLPVPHDLDGESLLGPIEGRIARGTSLPHFLAIEKLRGGGAIPRGLETSRFNAEYRSVTDGRWFLVVDSTGRRELYDWLADPLETTDLVTREPGQAARLAALLPVLPPSSPGDTARRR